MDIFNKSLDCDSFLITWKICLIVPIHKNGNRTNVSNYRSISTQNVMPKVFESLIVDKLSEWFKNITIDEQHGFVTGRSTITNLAVYQHFLISALEVGSHVDAADFRKAFDSYSKTICSWSAGESALMAVELYYSIKFKL